MLRAAVEEYLQWWGYEYYQVSRVRKVRVSTYLLSGAVLSGQYFLTDALNTTRAATMRDIRALCWSCGPSDSGRLRACGLHFGGHVFWEGGTQQSGTQGSQNDRHIESGRKRWTNWCTAYNVTLHIYVSSTLHDKKI